ncbi:MAG: hypothetical protein K1X57_11340 [Gemmataceae bacterium]|nr:hypothetical protein [Gemmataceae bacterium]
MQDFWGHRQTPVVIEHANARVDLDATNSDAPLQRRVYNPGWDKVAGQLEDMDTASSYSRSKPSGRVRDSHSESRTKDRVKRRISIGLSIRVEWTVSFSHPSDLTTFAPREIA